MQGSRFSSTRAAVAMAVLALVTLAASCTTTNEIAATEAADSATTEPATTEPASTEPVTTKPTAADPTPTGAPESGSELQSTFDKSAEERQAITEIRQIDFENGFTYETLRDFDSDLERETATVVDGVFENGEFGSEQYFRFYADLQAYGDLDGDGIEEAVVQTTWNGGGSGNFDSVRIYRLVDGEAQRAGEVGFGDRAFGGVAAVRYEAGLVRVWSFANGEGACCPNQIAETTLVLGEHSVVEADRSEPVTWMSLDPNSPTDLEDELKFLPNTSSAWVWAGADQTEATVTFEGAAGQRLKVNRNVGDNPFDAVLHDLTTGDVIADAGNIDLPTTGLYELTFMFFEERDRGTMLEIFIGDYRVPRVTWTLAIDQVLLQQEPFVHTSVTWPVFESAAPGTGAVNDVLGTFATELDDAWVSDVTEFEDPQDVSSYTVSYDVDIAADDLVSVTFSYFDYVCCRPYPNYGQSAAVLDLAAGRLIPVEEILDLSRISAITELWLAELAQQSEIPVEAIFLGDDEVRFDSLAVTAGGIEFGTDRGSLGGGLPGTRTTVSYVDLGDLVNADLVARING